VRSVLGGLNVRVHFSIPYNPDSKIVERWHRTMEEQFGATFATYCGGDLKSPRFKHAYDLARKHPELAPTVDQLREAFAEWLKAYHATPHTGAGMDGLSPAEAFERFDPIPRAVVPEGALDILLMRVTRPVKVTRMGVRYRGVAYGSRDPQRLAWQGREVLLRVDPEDASYVLVCDLEGRPFWRAVNDSLSLAGATQDDIGEAMRQRRRARKLIKQMHDGAGRAARQSVTEAAIAARLKHARRAAEQRAAATGTDDEVPVRNVRPLRSDLADAVRRLGHQVAPPPPAPDPSFADLDITPDPLPETEPDTPTSFADLWQEDGDGDK